MILRILFFVAFSGFWTWWIFVRQIARGEFLDRWWQVRITKLEQPRMFAVNATVATLVWLVTETGLFWSLFISDVRG